MSRLKQYFKIMRTLIRWYTNPEYLHFLYYRHKFNKLLRFYMKRCDHANDAAYEAAQAFSWIYLFDFVKSEEIEEEFKKLLG